jgi:hypothetical protein
LTAFSKILTAHKQGREKGLLPYFAFVAIVLAIVVIVVIAAIVAIATIAAFADPKQKKECPSHCIVQRPFSAVSVTVT